MFLFGVDSHDSLNTSALVEQLVISNVVIIRIRDFILVAPLT
jgi:hypothetical protein